MGKGRRRFAAVITLVAVASAVWAPAAPAAPAGPLQLVSSQRLDDRLTELTLRTTVLKTDTTSVRVLVPAGYDASGSTRYPVLYLLHGAIDDYKSWTDKGDAERLTAGLPLIVVMPDAGWDGYYSDQYNFGQFGPPMWETYHVDQLIPWIDGHFRTIAARRGRATAGLSMGGFGAMSYAARHPDLFVAAASFSGAVDTNLPAPVGQPDPALDGQVPYAVWGTRPLDEIRWRGHNPWDLAENLQGLALTIRTGNGYDASGNFSDPIEYQVHAESVSLDARLTELGHPHVFEDYGAGGHAWPFWQADLVKTLPWLMDTFANPPARPAKVTYEAIDPSYEAYGWHVSIDRDVLEFSRISDADASGFTLSGSGTAGVTTRALFTPRGSYHVVVDGPTPEDAVLRADRGGRLHLAVDLGPADTAQQFAPQALTAPTVVRTAHVQISPA